MVRFNSLKFILVALLALVGARNAMAGASADGTATMHVYVPIGISFDNVNMTFAAGWQEDGREGEACNASATFTVSGEPSVTYAADAPADTVMTLSGVDIPVTGITALTSSSGGSANTGTLNGSGSDTVAYCGNRGVVPSNATGGDYSGTFTATVNYN